MQRISSGSSFEEMAAYSRAVVDDLYIHISGTTGIDPKTGEMPQDTTHQARNIFHTIERVLAQCGATLSDVVRCRVFITEQQYLMDVVEVLADQFRDCPPANTTLICAIPAPGAKVEIEVTARRPS